MDINQTELLAEAHRANLAYQAPDAIRAAVEKRGHSVHVLEQPATLGQAFLELDAVNQIQWLVIRGTDNPTNALVDFEYHKDACSPLGVRWHHGFHECAKETKNTVVDLLQPNYRTRVVGHSLGGAVALVLAAWLRASHYNVERVITFGQPKVTNKAGVEALDGLPVLRVVHHRDIIPMVPPLTLISALGGRYHHYGPEAVVLDDGIFKFLTRHDAERLSLTSFWHNLFHESAADHRMEGYLNAIQRGVPTD